MPKIIQESKRIAAVDFRKDAKMAEIFGIKCLKGKIQKYQIFLRIPPNSRRTIKQVILAHHNWLVNYLKSKEGEEICKFKFDSESYLALFSPATLEIIRERKEVSLVCVLSDKPPEKRYARY